MMSQTFGMSGQHPVQSQDFMLMNNNYLPGISRLNGSVPLPCASDLPNRPPGSQPLLAMPNQDVDAERLSMNITDYNTAGTEISLDSSAFAAVDMEHMQLNLCEHEEGNLSPNANMSSINSDWTSSYYAGSQSSSVNSFTFTTPTQSYLHSPALTATAQNRLQSSLVRPQTFAPGCIAQFQHSAPRRVPLIHQASLSSPQDLSIFTDSQSSSVCSISLSDQTHTAPDTYSPELRHPVASCSESIRRPKRRHTIDIVDELAPSNKIHLTDEKIAKHMRDLRIHNFSPPSESSVHTGYTDTGQEIDGVPDMCLSDAIVSGDCSSWCDSDGSSKFMKHSQRQWHDFKVLEDRIKQQLNKLEMIDEDSDSERTSQPVLHLIEGIDMQPSTVIPQEILNKIRNPCQEVVLWSPPNVAVRTTVAEDSLGSSNDGGDMMEDTVCANLQSEQDDNDNVEDTGMETESIDDMLEL